MIAYFSKQIGGGRPLSVAVSLPADVDLELDYNRSFFFAEGPEQELDIPPEWHEAVLYGLASRSAGIFGTTQLDPAKVQRCDTQAECPTNGCSIATVPTAIISSTISPSRSR
jgi:hypothetical protein